MTFSIILLIFLTFAGAWISSAEIALFSLPSTKVRTFKQDKNPRKRLIAQLLSQPRDLLVTVFMINTLANILLQNVASDMFGKSASWLLKIGVPLVLTLILGEIVPKYIGLQNNMTIAVQVAPTVNFLQKILGPFRRWIIAITTPISRLLFFFLRKEENISREELEHVLETSEKHGVLDQDEIELVKGYLKLQDATVKEIMWPKEDILYYDINQPLSRLTYLFVEQECTRVPVCDGSIENVLGVISAGKFFHNQKRIHSPDSLTPLLVKPFYVPESTPTKRLVKRMDEKEKVMALIVDEYGSITGLITREDLIETVVGEISDLRDQQPLYTKAGENEIIASGKMELNDFNQYFHSDLKSEENMLTIGGWLIEQLGDIPKSGSKFELRGFLFHILAASPQRITRLYVKRLA